MTRNRPTLALFLLLASFIGPQALQACPGEARAGASLQVRAKELWIDDDTSHLMGGCRMGDDHQDSVVNADGRSWSIPNLWVCDGSLFPTSGGVNPSLTIQALALRIGERIKQMASRGEL